MAHAAFDARFMNVLERLLSVEHVNESQLLSHFAVREIMQQMMVNPGATAQGKTGFLGDSLRCYADGTGMTVFVRPGIGFMHAAADAPTTDPHPYKPVALSAERTLAIAASDPALNRVDIVQAQYDRFANDNAGRDILNATTGVFTNTGVNTTLSTDLIASTNLSVKTGTPGVAPVTPTPDAGHVMLATVSVIAASVTVPALMVADRRTMLNPDGSPIEAFWHIDKAAGAITSQYLPASSYEAVVRNGVGVYTIDLWCPGIQATGDIGSLVLTSAAVGHVQLVDDGTMSATAAYTSRLTTFAMNEGLAATAPLGQPGIRAVIKIYEMDDVAGTGAQIPLDEDFMYTLRIE